MDNIYDRHRADRCERRTGTETEEGSEKATRSDRTGGMPPVPVMAEETHPRTPFALRRERIRSYWPELMATGHAKGADPPPHYALTILPFL
jgi:hypothetical protein